MRAVSLLFILKSKVPYVFEAYDGNTWLSIIVIWLPLRRLLTDGHHEETKIIERLSAAMGLNVFYPFDVL